jgi:hypothetical protein
MAKPGRVTRPRSASRLISQSTADRQCDGKDGKKRVSATQRPRRLDHRHPAPLSASHSQIMSPIHNRPRHARGYWLSLIGRHKADSQGGRSDRCIRADSRRNQGRRNDEQHRGSEARLWMPGGGRAETCALLRRSRPSPGCPPFPAWRAVCSYGDQGERDRRPGQAGIA